VNWKREIKWKIFTNGTHKDYEFAKHILLKMCYSSNQINFLIQRQPKNPKDLVEIISGFKGIISFRLHSHIVAYSLKVPGVGIVWDNKVSFFYSSINRNDSCFKLNNDIGTIIDKLDENICHNFENKTLKKQKIFSKDLIINNLDKLLAKK
jgi:polysaccharide pyruvyl transferase WcaK-like protein